jgi:hypothetical protein
MKRNILFIFTIILIATTSCNKFLDVERMDLLDERRVFKDKTLALGAINGIYLSIGSTSLYGGNSQIIPDVLAQLYNPTSGNYATLKGLNYTAAGSRAELDNLWSSYYKVVLNINKIIDALPNSKGLFSDLEFNTYLGEMHGLRALLLLDIYRFFGPIPKNIVEVKLPYPLKPENKVHDLLTPSEFLGLLDADIEKSIELLAQDAIKNSKQLDDRSNSNPIESNRRQRFNIWASKALKARKAFYVGNNEVARTVATELIAEIGNKIPIRAAVAYAPAVLNDTSFFLPRHSLSWEGIFTSYKGFDISHQQRFVLSGTTATILAPSLRSLEALYTSPNDFRFREWFIMQPGINDTRKQFSRFIFTSNPNASATEGVYNPVIRISEIYFILAETATNISETNQIINSIRNIRGADELVITVANKSESIQNEFIREFWGEGQVWFFHKRLYNKTIKAFSETDQKSISDEQYVVTQPLVEQELR